MEEGRIGSIRVIDKAILPQSPIAPNKVMNIIIGMFIGIVLGVGMPTFSNALFPSVLL